MSAALQVDPQSLLLAQTTLAFITSPFLAPTYNFPLFLFGIYAVDKTETHDPLRLFSGLLGVSALLDIIWLIRTPDQSGLTSTLTVINLIVKVPTFFAILTALRQRGDSFGSLGGDFVGSQNVWSMPGGFGGGGRAGYDNVGDGEDVETAAPGRAAVPPPAPPKNPPQHQAPTAPGGYNTV